LDYSIKEINGLSVIHGPGSFTGLRISLSTVKGLALALNLPVVVMNALEVAARQVKQDGLICPAMDARRGEIFTALFRKKGDELLCVMEPRSISPQRWRDELPSENIAFCGPGASLYFDVLKSQGSELWFSDFILARTLASLSFVQFMAGNAIPGSEVRAAYLRPSDAEMKGPRPRKKIQFSPPQKR
jgi:tRNA threonylcarbamoyladenosine biosynthesis protein TsaB